MQERKVKFIGASDDQVNWGNNDDPRKFMKIGDIVTIVDQDIHSWHTKFKLKEFPGKVFNSVSFESA